MRTDEELLGMLPTPPRPQGGYVPAVVQRMPTGGGLVVTAGMTPRVDGTLRHRGRVGAEIDIPTAQEAAAIAAGNALAAALEALPSESDFDRVLRLVVYVNAVEGFEQHTAVADGASARLRELLAERGEAARSAVGVASLPGGACVELELTCSWSPRVD